MHLCLVLACNKPFSRTENSVLLVAGTKMRSTTGTVLIYSVDSLTPLVANLGTQKQRFLRRVSAFLTHFSLSYLVVLDLIN